MLASGLTHPYYGMRRLNVHPGGLHQIASEREERPYIPVDDVITTGSSVLWARRRRGTGAPEYTSYCSGGATRTGPGWRRPPRSTSIRAGRSAR